LNCILFSRLQDYDHQIFSGVNREMLLTLYRKGLINLPPGKHDGRNQTRNRPVRLVKIDQTPLQEKLSNFPQTGK